MNLKRFIKGSCSGVFGSCALTVLLFFYISNNNKIFQGRKNNSNLKITLLSTSDTGSSCQWPPKNLNSLKDSQTGFYDLTIPIIVQEHEQFNKYLEAYYDYLSKRYKGDYLEGSFLRRLVQMDEQIRITGSTGNYHLYPQYVNMEATVEAVKECRPVKQYPVNNPKLQVLRSPDAICAPKNLIPNEPLDSYPLDLIVFIKSCVDCTEHRQRIRSTFAKLNLWESFQFAIRFIFVTGLPVGKHNFQHLFIPNISHIQGNALDIQFMKTQHLINESDHYKDLLIGQFDDTYKNLTLKQIFTFHWISLFCQDQSQLFLFLDDDHTLVPAHLIEFIRAIPNELKPYFAGGSSYQPQTVIRPDKENPSKYAIDKNDFPWSIYVPYATGAGYILGLNIVQDLAIASRFTVPFVMEDVYVGIMLFKLKYNLVEIPEMMMTAPTLKIPLRVISAEHFRLNPKIDWESGKMID